MAFTATDLDNLDSAIAKGELSVTFADRHVTYRSIAELLIARDAVSGAVRAAAATRPKTYYARSRKGL